MINLLDWIGESVDWKNGGVKSAYQTRNNGICNLKFVIKFDAFFKRENKLLGIIPDRQAKKKL